jgi:hypothetical protein
MTLFLIENSLHLLGLNESSLLAKRTVRTGVPECRPGCDPFPLPQKWRRRTASTPQFQTGGLLD